MKTKEQVRKLLIECELLTPDQDPNPSSLSTVLLHLEYSISGITAPGVEAIRTVALILDSLTTPHNNNNHAPEDSSSKSKELNTLHPSTPPTIDLSNQITGIKTTIQELRKAAAKNETSANMCHAHDNQSHPRPKISPSCLVPLPSHLLQIAEITRASPLRTPYVV